MTTKKTNNKTQDENPVLSVVLPFGVVLLGVVIFRLLDAFTTPDAIFILGLTWGIFILIILGSFLWHWLYKKDSKPFYRALDDFDKCLDIMWILGRIFP